MKKIGYILFLSLMSVLLTQAAVANDLSPELLHGHWVVDTTDCKTTAGEFVEFRPNGTFETTRAGRTEILGFWRLEDDENLILDMVSSPSYFGDIHSELKDFKNYYGYYNAKLVVFNIQKSSFQVVGIMGNGFKKAKLHKCK